MGRIKPKLVKRTSRQLIESTEESFTKKFEDNKIVLGKTIPSKKVRNKIAGYIARIKKNTKKLIEND